MSARSTRVLHVNTLSGAGGAAVVAESIIKGLKQRGHSAELLVSHRIKPDADVLTFQELNSTFSLRTKIHRKISNARRAIDKTKGIESFSFPESHLINTIVNQFDALHFHNLHGDYFDLRLLPLLTSTKPSFITLHDSWLLGGHCAHPLDCNKWMTQCGPCPHQDIYQSIEKDGSRENQRRKAEILKIVKWTVISPSHWLLDRAKRSILYPSFINSHVIPNGVDLDRFKPLSKETSRLKLDIPRNAFVVLFVAHGIRNNPWKDFGTLEAAIKILSKNRLSKPFLFLAIGESGQQERVSEDVEVKWISSLEQRDLASYYSASNVYVHPAKMENFPNVILEAMACALPVVATRIGGIPEQVVDYGAQGGSSKEPTGILTELGNPKELAEALMFLSSNEQLANSLGLAGQKKCVEEFDLKTTVDRYTECYLKQ